MLVEKFSKSTSPSKYKFVLQRLKMLAVDFEMDLFGGEPTLHPEFLYIINELSNMEKCKLIEIKTNLSKPLHFLEKVFVSEKVRLAASYHAEYCNQEFIDKCIALKSNNFYCHINLSDNPKDWPNIIKLIDIFDENSVKYDLNILLSTPDYEVKYTEEFNKIFEGKKGSIADNARYRLKFDNGEEKHLSAFDVYKNNLASFTGYKCQALLYDISSDGKIVNSCNEKQLPLIVREDIFKSCTTCTKLHCHADMMLNFYKEKPQQ